MTRDPVDPTTIDWAERQQRAHIPFEVVNGRPVNPFQPELPAGRGVLWKWGERANADAIVLIEVAGRRWVLMGERGDGLGWAIPGGGLDPGETAVDGGLRELREETGLVLVAGEDPIEELPARYCWDPRNTREAWMVTTPLVIRLGRWSFFPVVQGDSDLRQCAWITADDLVSLEVDLSVRGGTLFESHRQMLTEILGGRL